jgi:uncharacterized GH25 family protein
VGEEVLISFGWGHRFPRDGMIKADRLKKVYILDPEGKEIPLEVQKDEKGYAMPIKVKFDKPGTYLIVAERKSGFISKTTRGYFPKPKDELKSVIKALWSEGSAKAIVNVEKPSGIPFLKAIFQRYQIIPLENPWNLKPGDKLGLMVILDGSPYRSWVYAVYEGFTDEKDTFAYATRSNKDGVAKIKILNPGIWLIKADEKLPYPDKSKADYYSFTSTLTFEVK